MSLIALSPFCANRRRRDYMRSTSLHLDRYESHRKCCKRQLNPLPFSSTNTLQLLMRQKYSSRKQRSCDRNLQTPFAGNAPSANTCGKISLVTVPPKNIKGPAIYCWRISRPQYVRGTHCE